MLQLMGYAKYDVICFKVVSQRAIFRDSKETSKAWVYHPGIKSQYNQVKKEKIPKYETVDGKGMEILYWDSSMRPTASATLAPVLRCKLSMC